MKNLRGTLLSLTELEAFLRAVDREPGPPLAVVLVGGAAVQLLCRNDLRVTRDIDTLDRGAATTLERIAHRQRPPIDVNRRADMFEAFLPPEWESHARTVFVGPRDRLTVIVPAPEDLAVMKVFRMDSKDADDIALLAALPGFDRDRFRTGFTEVLKVAIGTPRLHAQSFCLVWESLFPTEPLDVEDLLRGAVGP